MKLISSLEMDRKPRKMPTNPVRLLMTIQPKVACPIAFRTVALISPQTACQNTEETARPHIFEKCAFGIDPACAYPNDVPLKLWIPAYQKSLLPRDRGRRWPVGRMRGLDARGCSYRNVADRAAISPHPPCPPLASVLTWCAA